MSCSVRGRGRKSRRLPEHHTDALHVAPPVIEGREPADPHEACGRAQDARQDLDGGGLARAVGSDEPEQLAALQIKRDAGEGLHLAMAPR
jgi:hypothetical protein